MKKKEELIPSEKSKKVIKLDKRGKKNAVNFMTVLMGLLGLICISYCIVYACVGKFVTSFFFIWAFIGAGFGILAYLCYRQDISTRIPRWLRHTFWTVFSIGVVFTGYLTSLIISGFKYTASDNADYVIVLGCMATAEGPSPSLELRLNKAINYMNGNTSTKAIVSGWQGKDEPMSEALCMKEYMVTNGIAEERIIMEDKSSTTYENLRNSKDIIESIRTNENGESGEPKVVIVTNDFHCYRAGLIARSVGYKDYETLSAGSYKISIPNNILRECMSLVKNVWIGTIILGD